MSDNLSDKTCSKCKSSEIVCGVSISQSVETGCVGLQYKDGLLLVGTEPLLADLCTNCGHIEQLYINNTNHKWLCK